MNDADIIKALECLAGEEEILCRECAFYGKDHGFACKKNVSRVAIEIINRQKTEIERLKGVVSQNEGVLPQYEALLRAEAIKEFAERLCEDRVSNDPVVISTKCLVKEMTGE